MGGGRVAASFFARFLKIRKLTPRVLYDVFGASSGQITFYYASHKIVDIIEQSLERIMSI